MALPTQAQLLDFLIRQEHIPTQRAAPLMGTTCLLEAVVVVARTGVVAVVQVVL
jgi:hypothetical protein